jgi:small subunit ribosomal protein S6
MRRYELMLLFRPDLEDDKLQSAVEKVTRAIVNAGGGLTKVSPWGKRRMAYEIQHFREASYFLLHFDIAPSAIREIERGLLISEEILRHLVTVLDHQGEGLGDEDEEPVEAVAPARNGDEAHGSAARGTEPDELPSDDAAADRVEAAENSVDEAVEDAGEVAEPVATGRARRVANDEES